MERDRKKASKKDRVKEGYLDRFTDRDKDRKMKGTNSVRQKSAWGYFCFAFILYFEIQSTTQLNLVDLLKSVMPGV